MSGAGDLVGFTVGRFPATVHVIVGVVPTAPTALDVQVVVDAVAVVVATAAVSVATCPCPVDQLSVSGASSDIENAPRKPYGAIGTVYRICGMRVTPGLPTLPANSSCGGS